MDITILGGGHGCFAAAAELAENAHTVRWWRRDTMALDALRALGALGVRDHRGSRNVPVSDTARAGAIHPVADLAEAVRGATLVVVPLPATVHEDLAARVAPLLQDGQVVFLPPGTFGTLLFAKAMAEAGNTADVALAETGTLPYLARTHGPAEVVVSGYATRLPTGVFPVRSSDAAFRVLREAYPSVEPVEDSLSGALMNAGPVIHPPLILMNAGPLEHSSSWDIHNEGPSRRSAGSPTPSTPNGSRSARRSDTPPRTSRSPTTTRRTATSGCTVARPTNGSQTAATGGRRSTCSTTGTCWRTPASACRSWCRSDAGPASKQRSHRAC